MADNLGPILPLPRDETTAGDAPPTADPPGRGTATGTDSNADHLQTDVGRTSDKGHNWNMDPPGSEVDATVREA